MQEKGNLSINSENFMPIIKKGKSFRCGNASKECEN